MVRVLDHAVAGGIAAGPLQHSPGTAVGLVFVFVAAVAIVAVAVFVLELCRILLYKLGYSWTWSRTVCRQDMESCSSRTLVSQASDI